MLFRQEGQPPQETAESDSWYVTYGIQDAYDEIVKETDGWREKAMARRSKSRFSLSRKKPEFYVVDQEAPPRLYRLKDERAGVISFELTEVGEGGTTIKATFGPRTRSLVQNLRANMPVTVPTSGPKACPTCGKEMMPDFKTCPYCGTKLK